MHGRFTDALTVWCDLRGASWYGATRAEAIENFQKHLTELSERGPQREPETAKNCAKSGVGDSREQTGNSPLSGAATIAGWEVSGLTDEAVNALLTEKEGA